MSYCYDISMQKLLKQITEKKKIIIPVLAGVALLGWFGWYLWHWEHREPLLEVHFFDVEKGSAVFLRTPSGKTALIGGGQGSDIIRNLTDVMPFYERKIDTVIYPIDPMSGVGLADVVGRYDVVETIRVASSSEQTRFVLDEVRGTGNIVGAPVILESLVIGTTSGALLKLTHGGNSFIIADSISRKDQQIYAIGTGETRADVLQLRSAAKTKMSTLLLNLWRHRPRLSNQLQQLQSR
jgi:hypothetical protein